MIGFTQLSIAADLKTRDSGEDCDLPLKFHPAALEPRRCLRLAAWIEQ